MIEMTQDQTKKVELRVSGMTCASCATTIEKSLLNLNNVSSASVNLGKETASVEYDPKKLKINDLETAVKDAGYDVINERYEHGSILLTSNRALEEWPALFGNPLLASAALDRLTHNAQVVRRGHRGGEREEAVIVVVVVAEGDQGLVAAAVVPHEVPPGHPCRDTLIEDTLQLLDVVLRDERLILHAREERRGRKLL